MGPKQLYFQVTLFKTDLVTKPFYSVFHAFGQKQHLVDVLRKNCDKMFGKVPEIHL